MKKDYLGLLATSVFSLAIGALLATKNVSKVQEAKADEENVTRTLDPSNYESHYLARFVNQDKIAVVSGGANYEFPSFDPTSSVKFICNYAKYEPTHTALRIGSYGSATDLPLTTSKSINNATEGIFKEIYDDVKDVCTNNYNVAIVSDKYIENIQDIAIYWDELPENSSNYKSFLRIVYLTDDSDTWKVLLRDDGEGTPWKAYDNYTYSSVHGGTGVSGFDNHVAFSGKPNGTKPSSSGDFSVNLKGKNARIGIVIGTQNSAYNMYYYLTAIMINRSQAIKSYIDFLDNYGWVCGAMEEDGNNYNTFLKMGGYKMRSEHANALNVQCTLVNGREPTYYAQFSYFYNHVFNTALPASPSSSLVLKGLFGGVVENPVILVVAVIGIVGVSGVVILAVRKKRKSI